VTDPLFGADWSHDIGNLGGLDQAEFSQNYTIPDSQTIPFTNTATVTATDAYGLQLTATSSDTVYKPGSCTAQIMRGGMTSNVWWALLVIFPVMVIIAWRRYRRILRLH
jgi:hypothetical protein